MIIPDSSTWKHLFCISPLFVRGTTLYICMSDLLLYFHHSYKENLPCLLFYVEMRNLADKAESHTLCKHGNILLSLTLKEITILNMFNYPKRRALMKIYRVVRQMKRGNCVYRLYNL